MGPLKCAVDTQAREHTENWQKWDKRAHNKPPYERIIIFFLTSFTVSFFFRNIASLFPDCRSKYSWWRFIQRQSRLWRGVKPVWRVCAWVYLRFTAPKVRNALGCWNKATKPGTIAHHQLFHSFLPGLELHEAGAHFQEGKAQKSPLVVCFYQRIPQFDTLWKH